MTDKKNTTIPTHYNITDLMDVFDESSNKKDHIDILIQNNLPETKAMIETIHTSMAEYRKAFAVLHTAQEARDIIEHQEFKDTITQCAINATTKQELVKQLIQIMKISTDKHRRYVTERIISMIIDLGENVNQKKMIVTMVANEIKKYINSNKHRQATFLSKELDSALEDIKYSKDGEYYSSFRQKASKSMNNAKTHKESWMNQQWFANAEKLFAQGQYDKAEKIFRKLIQPEHIMRSDISATQFIHDLDGLLTASDKSSFPRKLRTDGKTIQIPYRYLKKYFEKVLSMDRAVLSTEFMIYHDQERIIQTKPYKLEKIGF